MKTYAIIRTENIMWDTVKSIYGTETIEAKNFKEAVSIFKKYNNIDIMGTPLLENIVEEDVENEIFSFKNNRARYQGDTFELLELTDELVEELSNQ